MDGYSDTGKWKGAKELVDMWKDQSWRQRIKATVKGLSFYGTNGQRLGMNEYITEIETFDPTALDDDLSSMEASSIAPSAPSTPSKPVGSSSSDKRPRHS